MLIHEGVEYPGLVILPNSTPPANIWQFTDFNERYLYPANLNAYGSYQVNDVAGVPWADQIAFTLRRQLFFNMHFTSGSGGPWAGVFARGVTQVKLADGQTMLIPHDYPCQMCRACWDVYNPKTGGYILETATGVPVITRAEVGPRAENWEFTLYRGDFMLDQLGAAVEATANCSGGA